MKNKRAARAARTARTRQQLGVPQLRFWKQLEQTNVNLFFLIDLFTATAPYRLLPEITIEPCEDKLADKLMDCFSDGVKKVTEDENGIVA